MNESCCSLKIEQIFKSLSTSEKGLKDTEVERQRKKYGFNEIIETKKISPFQIFIRQFTSLIILILMAAVAISMFVGELLDAAVISIIVVFNGLFGFVQEYRAEKAIEALKKLAAPRAKVIRDGTEYEVDSRELVPGDIILLETGDKVPADARLFEIFRLEVDESSLTGESVPVVKNLEPVKSGSSIIEQKNMVFMSTIATRGRAKAVVVKTGMATEIGKIAKIVQEVKQKLTPLQIKLNQFGSRLAFATLGICALVFAIGILREYLTVVVIEVKYLVTMFMAAVSLAVAAIPEGLPAIVTISLALGIQRMVKRNALIRQLPAVETLGCTDVICSDKTGTLTKNKMTVREIFCNHKLINVTEGGSQFEGQNIDRNEIEFLLRIGALCNDARINQDNNWKVFGDPTEAALLISAAKAGLKKEELEVKFPRIDEIPFDHLKKYMVTIHDIEGKRAVYFKGAPEELLKKCGYIQKQEKVERLTDKERKDILEVNQDMAGRALRVLGFAYKYLDKSQPAREESEEELVFVGLQGMIDPPREEAKESIQKCKTAGIKTIMVTGDHKLTAIAVAREIGLLNETNIDKVLTGEELDKLSPKEFDEMVEDIAVYARISPHHKVMILDALKKKGHIVAMTGDGVNDAPALKKSDIGVAMGVTGTDVAKEASDMVLTDDNFASIANAVEEGRGIYNSIKNFIQYTLSSNLGEILVVFLAILIGWPPPLIAIQILYVNLLTDGLPGLALGLDPFEKDIMRKPPRKRDEAIMGKEVIQNILIVGCVMCVGTLFLFYRYGAGGAYAQSVAFTALIMFQLFNVLTYRAKNFKININASKFLLGSVIISILMQFAVLYTPLCIPFKTVPLGWLDWAYIILVSFSLYVVLELRKMLMTRSYSSGFKTSIVI